MHVFIKYKFIMIVIKIFIFAILANIICAEYKFYFNYKVYKIVPTTDHDVQILMDIKKEHKYNFWTEVIRVGADVRIMVAPETVDDFEQYLHHVDIKFEVAIEDVQKLIDAQVTRPNKGRSNNEYAWDYYQSLEEIYEWLDKIVEDYPDIVSKLTIGKTVEGRDIRGIKIDYKQQENATIGMLEGGIHAREWISPATLTWITNQFLISSDPNVRYLAENIVWHIIPVTNPDGYSYTFTNNRMWRKTRNPANNGSCAAFNLSDDMSNGIDLNRNFGFLWMTIGASSEPCDQTYAGPVANSELETLAIINHVNTIKQQGHMVYYLAFHSFSEMVLVPYSHTGGNNVLEVGNYGDLYEIAIRGMKKLKEKHGTEYLVGTSMDILYPTSGGSFDWVKGVADIPIVYLFELRDKGYYGFLLPPEQIIPNSEEVLEGLIEMDRITRRLGYYNSGNVLKLNIMLPLLAILRFIITV